MRGTFHAKPAVAAALTAALTLTAGLAGCAEEEKPPSLPSLTPSTAAPTSTAGMTDEEQIRWIYRDYAANWIDAQDVPSAERRHFLAKWTIDPQRTATVDVLVDNEEKHLRLEGKSVPHIFKLEIDGETAVVNDCSDDRKATIKNTRTSKVKRFNRNWYVVKLKKLDYGWRVQRTDMRSESCVGR